MKNLLILFSLISFGISHAQQVNDEFVNNNLKYRITSLSPNIVEVIGHDPNSANVTVNINETVTYNSNTYTISKIVNGAFGYDPHLYDNTIQITSLTLPNTLKSIGYRAFEGNFISILEIPNSVESIESNAFYKNEIDNLTLPKHQPMMEGSVFSKNELININIPDAWETLPSGIFSYNHFTTLPNLNNVNTIGSWSFISNQINSLIIPEGVERIGERAFYANPLTDISLPSTLMQIDALAFEGNSNISSTLTTVTSYSRNPATLPGNAFQNNNSGILTLYIPEGTTQDYINKGWNSSIFSNIIELPKVTSVVVPASDTYVNSNTLTFTVYFSNNVAVDNDNGTPQLEITIGGTRRMANYSDGSGSNALTFTYTVQAGDTDYDGIEVNQLLLNKGKITFNNGNVPLELRHIGRTSGILIKENTTAMQGGVGINTETPKSAFDVVGGIRALNRDANGVLYTCDAETEGTFSYDTEDNHLKVCTDQSGEYHWQIIKY